MTLYILAPYGPTRVWMERGTWCIFCGGRGWKIVYSGRPVRRECLACRGTGYFWEPALDLMDEIKALGGA